MKTKNDGGLNKLAHVEEIKAVSETGEFEGYASVFGVTDQGGDVVVAGAFRRSLAERPAPRVKMLWQHDRDKPIGRWLEMREDGRGLFVKGKVLISTQVGRDAYENLREGVVDGLSIGYRTNESEYDAQTGVRRLKEVDLIEVSVVTMPMLEDATISSVKALADLKTIRDFEEALVNGTLPRLPAKDAKALLASGFKAMRTERDAGNDGGGLTEALNKLAESFRRS